MQSFCVFHRKKHGEKVALITHSMGAKYVFYFFRWVTEQVGDQWIDEKLRKATIIYYTIKGP